MNIFQHPQTYAVALCGRSGQRSGGSMGYENESYRQLYSAPYHIGKSVREDIKSISGGRLIRTRPNCKHRC